ncbi:MAG: hypothetical protein ACI4DZ_16025 [Oliverpabstia sp.]
MKWSGAIPRADFRKYVLWIFKQMNFIHWGKVTLGIGYEIIGCILIMMITVTV